MGACSCSDTSKAKKSLLSEEMSNEEALQHFKDNLKNDTPNIQEAFYKLGGADDNKISKEEFYAFCSSVLQYSEDDCARLFKLCDRNKDGWIMKSEFLMLVKDPDSRKGG
eukprot:gnl/MRDRNA2_/MRDRNA2_148572_c0_seq1.p1 gnl/MRDRNA2_/MRDRNA2_148572_c0~~gnl/MRDRNA2_/MRDRNA2_148572_c0_seq1.p1  ORF type:complete len:110 (+),score=24.25 gnl/MRDRNA2_/MRDRNA2_148572_c0_seq1:99-428(+)